MSISFAVTAYNEMSEGRKHGYKLLKCIELAQRHPTVGEIVIVDDGSEDWAQLVTHLGPFAYEGVGWGKTKIYHNRQNLGVFGNKLEAIAQCRDDWVVNCDSDNLMDANYLDMVASLKKNPNTWYCPSFARPEFDYRGLVGRWDLPNIEGLLAKPLAECALNTGNQIVHRESFMKVFGGYRGRRFDLLQPNYLDLPTSKRTTHRHRLVYDAKDSLIFNMEWLFAGGVLEIVPGLEYDHYYTSGPESNYARAPEEKDKLNDVLIAELRRRSQEERGNRVKRGEYT
jgi:glycosyltransferase involved in cell wall biosynthesis